MSMPPRFRRGLVVGKFCPLHRGHMLLIDTALAACEEVVVISYTKPEFAGCGPAMRRGWLGDLYPQVTSLVVDDVFLADWRARHDPAGLGEWQHGLPPNDAPDAVHRAFTAWLCRAVLGVAIDAIFTSEDYGDGFAAALSRYFSDRAGAAQPVAHVCVDRARSAVPISGSAIRQDPHRYRAFLDPRVYADFVGRVRLLGGESSGKTTLASALALELDTVLVPEYGRGYWEARGGELVFEDMRRIAEGQVRSESALAGQAQRWLICDGSALTSACYSALDFGRVDPVVADLAARPYAFTFLCVPDFPFAQDGTRRNAEFRARQHAWYVETLERAGQPYTLLAGSVQERVMRARALLARHGQLTRR